MSTKLQREIVNIIAGARRDRSLSYGQLAKEIGCTGNAISNWEKGKRSPNDMETIERVLGNLGYRLVIEKAGKGERHEHI